MEALFEILNTNKIFNGCIMILMNIGSKHIISDISSNVDKIFNKPLVRLFFVFCVAFIATRDIKSAILLTLIFIVMFKFLLDNKSKMCLLSKDGSDDIGVKEYLNAKKIIHQYEKNNQVNK
jgi:hypothetical protein